MTETCDFYSKSKASTSPKNQKCSADASKKQKSQKKKRNKRSVQMDVHTITEAYIAAMDKAKGRSAPRIIDSVYETLIYMLATAFGILLVLKIKGATDLKLTAAEAYIAAFIIPSWITRIYGEYRHGHQLWYTPL